MNDNAILTARKPNGGCVDRKASECEQITANNQRRREAEEAKRKAEAERALMWQMEKKAAEQAEFARRRRQVYLTFGLVLSVGGLMALTLTGLMHTVVGMAFIAGTAAVLGWMLGRNH